jgi:protease-4
MQKSFLRETAGVIMRAVVVVVTIVVVIGSISALYEVKGDVGDGACNIAVLPLEGTILPFHGIGDFEMIITPESVESFMDVVEKEKGIEGVLVEVNSPGGTPVASERIAERFRSSDLPIVGLAGDMAASGGYMIASAADYLIASPMSEIGSIGVTMSYTEESKKNEEEGITYVQLTSAKYKDMGSPNRPITDEERALLEANLLIIHNRFVDIVADYRKMDRSAVEALADGSAMPGVRALEKGLVDKLGGRAEARQTFADLLNKNVDGIKFCEYKRSLLPF